MASTPRAAQLDATGTCAPSCSPESVRNRRQAVRHPLRAVVCLASVALGLALATISLADEGKVIKTLDFEPKDGKREREVPLRVYLPAKSQPCPVVLFSHGLGGSRENNAYLGNHWARHGYLCVFMQHPGSDESVWRELPARERLAALTQAAGLRSFTDRNQDVSFVIDQLERWNRDEKHPLQGRMDLEHIGMSGHSFGAVTTLAVAGRRLPLGKNFQEPRIDAFVAFSPQPGKGDAARALGKISSPMLCMTGTKDDSPIDRSVTPEVRREVYKALPTGDKFELVFDDGHHFTFGDTDLRLLRNRDPAHHPAIQTISLKFWDAYLKGDAKAKQWLQSEQQCRQGAKLKAADIWQWK
ncbi:MAG: dienelactone hydrolase [Planctomycetales bacterium]|nr:dienelactone hydrolase [Planctomycetales bacterium]